MARFRVQGLYGQARPERVKCEPIDNGVARVDAPQIAPSPSPGKGSAGRR